MSFLLPYHLLPPSPRLSPLTPFPAQGFGYPVLISSLAQSATAICRRLPPSSLPTSPTSFTPLPHPSISQSFGYPVLILSLGQSVTAICMCLQPSFLPALQPIPPPPQVPPLTPFLCAGFRLPRAHFLPGPIRHRNLRRARPLRHRRDAQQRTENRNLPAGRARMRLRAGVGAGPVPVLLPDGRLYSGEPTERSFSHYDTHARRI